MKIRTSSNGVEFIKSYETFQPKAYKAHKWEKFYTIGYGHCAEDVKKGQVINETTALEYLEKDIGNHESGVTMYINKNLTQNQFDALSSLVFNVGKGALKGTKLAKDLNEGKVSEAAKEILSFNHSGGKVDPGLTDRRKAEYNIFMYNKYENHKHKSK